MLVFPAIALPDEEIIAITMPMADVTLSFIQPGRIAKVNVREGEMVQAGQMLMQQDDAAEQAQLSLLKEQSEDMTQIHAQGANLEQKRVYLGRLKWAADRGSATEQEMEDAELAVKIAEYALKAAEFEHEQNMRKYEEAKIRVDNMSLKSPIAGRVEKIEVKVGESIDALAKAVRVVKINPLWIDVHVPYEKGRTVKLSQAAKIIFPGDEEKASKGRIVFISTVADAASSTLRIRIEVPNKTNRPAGEQVRVLFSEP